MCPGGRKSRGGKFNLAFRIAGDRGFVEVDADFRDSRLSGAAYFRDVLIVRRVDAR